MKRDPFAPEARQATTFAPRTRLWPPDGYRAPDPGEFTALRTTADRFAQHGMTRAARERMDDATLTRSLQLIELMGDTSRAVYEYAHALRREMTRRGLVHRSIAILRCESCSHSTERLFEATQKTHPDMINRSSEPVDSAWFCARCWSGDSTETEGADEGEAGT
ncbi:hypothetical protein [Streptomyces marianii]|uniref:Uncharacterized protein n=1 Tax=Streptomyces marianii TaxID=1817406 RepID=A0A5R9DSF9_9ACTN|nr:hypothetical protein [Streptomyces marianii]TLQ39449.1 hypothetical protein FEF34_39465 [Streptomyces marianii]